MPNNFSHIPGNEDIELSPKDRLIESVEHLNSNPIDGLVHDLTPEIIDGLNDCEVAIALAAVESAPLVNNIYKSYLSDSNYVDWPTFWNNQIETAREIAAIYFKCADSIPNDPRYEVNKEYLYATAVEWVLGQGRSQSEAEMLWYNMRLEDCRLVLRSSPKMEEGAEAYAHPERLDGGNASLTLRFIQESSSSDGDSGDIFTAVEAGILEVLDAEDEWRNNFEVDHQTHYVLVRTAMHGGDTGPTAHQYKRVRTGAPTRVRIITNHNLYLQNSAKFLSRIDNYFSQDLVEDMRAIVIEDIPELRSGHEVSEAIMERIYAEQITKIGSREAVELLATLIPIEGIMRQVRGRGDGFDVLSDKMTKRFIVGCVDLRSRKPDIKLIPYLKGDDFAMERFLESEAIRYNSDGAIDFIDLAKGREVIHEIVVELLDILKRGDKEAHDERLK